MRDRFSTRRRRRRRIVALTIAGGMLLLAIAGWLSLQHIPAWYNPQPVPAVQLQHVKDDLVATVASLSERMNGGAPFTFRITQAQLNAWLAAREQIWPPAQAWIPPEMENPYVVFRPGRIVLAGTVRWGGIRTVLSAAAAPSVTDAGVTVRLSDIRGGSLPVPDAWVRQQLESLELRQRRRHAEDPATMLPLGELLEGASFPAEFVWPNPHRPFRLLDIRVEDGALTLEIQPLPRSGAPTGRSHQRPSSADSHAMSNAPRRVRPARTTRQRCGEADSSTYDPASTISTVPRPPETSPA
jgi:hypothetical protein